MKEVLEKLWRVAGGDGSGNKVECEGQYLSDFAKETRVYLFVQGRPAIPSDWPHDVMS